MIVCQSWFSLSSGPFLTLPLFCSALLCGGTALCEAGFPGFHELRYRSTDGRLQSVEKEKLEYFSRLLSAPGSEFQAVAGAPLSLQLWLEQIYYGYSFYQPLVTPPLRFIPLAWLTELIIYKVKNNGEKSLLRKNLKIHFLESVIFYSANKRIRHK